MHTYLLTMSPNRNTLLNHTLYDTPELGIEVAIQEMIREANLLNAHEVNLTCILPNYMHKRRHTIIPKDNTFLREQFPTVADVRKCYSFNSVHSKESKIYIIVTYHFESVYNSDYKTTVQYNVMYTKIHTE